MIGLMLTQLLQLRTIAEQGTLTKAAQILKVSQPALSTMIKKLEAELEVELFVRKNNRLILSPAGAIVLSYSNAICEQMDAMKKSLQVYKASMKKVRAGFCSRACMWYFTPRFQMAYSDIALEAFHFVENSDSAGLLLSEGTDILVTSKPMTGPGIKCTEFLTDNHFFSVMDSHPLAKYRDTGVFVSDIKQYAPIYYLDQGVDDSFCIQYKRFFHEKYPDIPNLIYFDFFEYAQEMEKPDTVAVTTKLAAFFRKDKEGRTLVPVLDQELSIRYYLCYLEENNRKAGYFLNWNEYADGYR